MKTYRVRAPRVQARLFLILARLIGVYRAEHVMAWLLEHGTGVPSDPTQEKP